MKAKILTVFGTRPEAIKMAPIVRELERHPAEFDSVVCVTGQHRELLDQVLELFDIRPDHDLSVMKASQSLTDVTCSVLRGLGEVFALEKPDLVLVHGDTTTTMAASLAAFYLKIAVGHVEAGLRTDDIYSPFPEEVNRRITSTLANLHFTPTERARQNLLREGVSSDSILTTGNTVIDALFATVERLEETGTTAAVSEALPFLDDGDESRLLLVTAHRRENF